MDHHCKAFKKKYKNLFLLSMLSIFLSLLLLFLFCSVLLYLSFPFVISTSFDCLLSLRSESITGVSLIFFISLTQGMSRTCNSPKWSIPISNQNLQNINIFLCYSLQFLARIPFLIGGLKKFIMYFENNENLPHLQDFSIMGIM